MCAKIRPVFGENVYVEVLWGVCEYPDRSGRGGIKTHTSHSPGLLLTRPVPATVRPMRRLLSLREVNLRCLVGLPLGVLAVVVVIGRGGVFTMTRRRTT